MHCTLDDFVTNRHDRVFDLLRLHKIVTHDVDNLALVVGDVIVLEEILTNVEVMRFNLALRAFDLARQQFALDCLTFTHTGTRQQALGPLRIAEDAHERIFHGQVEPG